jgi:hypothetical protein
MAMRNSFVVLMNMLTETVSSSYTSRGRPGFEWKWQLH